MLEIKDKLKFTASMVIFGTIGLFVRFISFPSAIISMCRGFLGAVFLITFVVLSRKKFSFEQVRKNFFNLFFSGICLGFNWIMLFESYKYTSVATATLCNYMAPIFIIIVSPLVFREKLTVKKSLCVLASVIGMVLVSNVLDFDAFSKSQLKGIILGLLSAVLYAFIIIFNKGLKEIESFEKTIVQLLVCGTVMLGYSLISGDIMHIEFSTLGIILLLTVCVVHTGLNYLLYFGSMGNIKAQTVAILSYIDPVVAVIVSAIILKEPINGYGIFGAFLIIGSAVLA